MPQYQGVWTVEQQAQALTNQQWVTDPNFKNTTLLLQADGTGSGSQNQTFLDGSTNNFFITRNGNTTQGSFSPFSQAPGYWGNYFNGSSYLNTSSLAAMPSSFTIEGWVYITSTSTQRFVNGSFYLDIVVATGSNMKLQFYDGATVTADAINVIPLNTWTHVAVVRSGGGSNNCSFYVNGVRGTQFTSAVSFGSSAWQIGALSSSSQYFYGYISNLRFCNSAVYTGASFTPTTTTLTTTSQGASSCILLTCQSNRFLDNSATAATFTTGGTPSVQAFAPFAPALQWTPDVVGGSAFFDGVGDNLTWAGTAAGSGAFSYEFWLYSLVDFSSNRAPLGVLAISGYNSALDVRMTTTTINMSAYNVANNNFTVPTLVPNTWYHVVLCRNASNQATVFLNGVRSSTGAVTITQNFAGLTTVIGAQDAVSNPGERTTGYLTGIRLISGSTPYDPTQSTITVPTAPLTAITNTSLLLNATNAGIYDGKMGNVLETVGNAQVSTNPVKYGSGSMYFPPTNGNYCVSPPNQPNLLFGTGNFTIEAWVYPISFTNTASGAFGYGLSGGYVDWNLEISTSGAVLYIDNDAGRFTSSSNLSANTWTHLCVVRTNTGVTMYFNGVSVGSYSTINNISGSSTSARLYVGTGAQVPGSRQFIGYIDDLRITKGVARYFTTFTPPQQALPRQ
jgi:hypothetical protein